MTSDDDEPMTPDEALAKIQEAVKNDDIHFAEGDELEKYPDEERRFLDVLESVTGISGTFISDMSSVRDFGLDDDELMAMSEALGVSVKEVPNTGSRTTALDKVVDVLKAMRIAGAVK